MKNILILLLLPLLFKGQGKFAEYKDAFSTKPYQIELGKNKDGKFTFYIEARSGDKLVSKTSIVIDDKDLPKFKAFLMESKETYLKWKKTAEDNQVKELNKVIESKEYKGIGAFYSGSSWYYDFNVKYTTAVMIISEKILLVLRSDKLEASSNEFITCTGLSIPFSSPEHVDEFLKLLDEEKAIKTMEEKNKTDNLFKE